MQYLYTVDIHLFSCCEKHLRLLYSNNFSLCNVFTYIFVYFTIQNWSKVFIVPGDNEFQDCQNMVDAWRWWMKCMYILKTMISDIRQTLQFSKLTTLCSIRSLSVIRFWQWQDKSSRCYSEFKWLRHNVRSKHQCRIPTTAT